MKLKSEGNKTINKMKLNFLIKNSEWKVMMNEFWILSYNVGMDFCLIQTIEK